MSKFINSEEFSYLGRLDFHAAFEIQKNLWTAAKHKSQSSIMGLEHPLIITLGRRADMNSVLCPHIPVTQATRGGLATLHSEGQLVIYPIINLKEQKLGVKKFVEKLLFITQKTFSDFDVKTSIDDQRIGLYTDQGKIAFCGLEIKEGISQHGLSININNDLSLFENIVSCGVQAQAFDRLQNYRFDVNTKTFFSVWIKNWQQVFLNH